MISEILLWPAGGIAAVGTLVAPRGVIARIATAVARPRTAAYLADRSSTANRYAAAIAAGEAAARAADDRLALAAGCAVTLREVILAEAAALVWWDKGLTELAASPVEQDVDEPLALAACLQYALDLAHDELRAAGRGYEANRTAVAMGAFLTSSMLDRIPGWSVLDRHRAAGIFDLVGPCDDLAPMCPFCGLGVYDQTIIGCSECERGGEFTRTVPDVWTGGRALPKRIAPDLAAGRRRVAGIERRVMATAERGF